MEEEEEAKAVEEEAEGGGRGGCGFGRDCAAEVAQLSSSSSGSQRRQIELSEKGGTAGAKLCCPRAFSDNVDRLSIPRTCADVGRCMRSFPSQAHDRARPDRPRAVAACRPCLQGSLHQRDASLRWPDASLTVTAADQGGDGNTAQWFLSDLGVCNYMLNDQSHRANNDVGLAEGDSKLKWVWAVVSPLFKLDTAPWGEGRWWGQLRQGLTDYLSTTKDKDNEDCPIISSHFNEIAMEINRFSERTHEGFGHIVRDSIKDAAKRKLGATKSSNWFNKQNNAFKLLDVWWRRCAMYLFILICVGAPSSEFRRHHDMVLQAAGDLGAAAAGDDAAGGAQQGAVRQRLRNAVEYAVLVMSDPSIRQSASGSGSGSASGSGSRSV